MAPARVLRFVVPLAAAAALATATEPAAAARTVDVPILMYHRIGELSPSLPSMEHRLTVDPRTFGKQMEWLAAHRWHAITQQQLHDALIHGRRLPRRPVLITFDDGYRDVYDHALPVLARLHMPATAYVISERITAGNPFLTWRMLRALERGGIEIGSHTVTHADLTTLDDGRATAELVRSRRSLERGLGHPVPWLAYPYGGENPRVVALARRAGYLLAATTHPGRQQHASEPLRLSRYGVIDSTGVAGLAAMLG